MNQVFDLPTAAASTVRGARRPQFGRASSPANLGFSVACDEPMIELEPMSSASRLHSSPLATEPHQAAIPASPDRAGDASSAVRARLDVGIAPILAGLVCLSAAVRSIVAWQHRIPRLFPDEYIYTALGRSIAHGHLTIRGGPVWFPGILEPVVAAPIWRFAGPSLAYHLVQVENAIVA